MYIASRKKETCILTYYLLLRLTKNHLSISSFQCNYFKRTFFLIITIGFAIISIELKKKKINYQPTTTSTQQCILNMSIHINSSFSKKKKKKKKKSAHVKIHVYFSIKPFFLHIHFSKHLISNYPFYTTFNENIKFYFYFYNYFSFFLHTITIIHFLPSSL